MELIKLEQARSWLPFNNADYVRQEIVSEVQGARFVEAHTSTAAPGVRADPHTHPAEQVFVVLSGELIVFNDAGVELSVTPGKAVFISANEPHGTRNPLSEEAVFIAITAPPFE